MTKPVTARKRKRPQDGPGPKRDPNVCQFWNDKAKQWSDRLWHCNDLQTAPSLGLAKSWFTVNVQKPCQAPDVSPPLWSTITASVPTPPKTAPHEQTESLRTRRVRVHPTDEQASTLKQMFGLTRWVYNKCVDVFDTIKEYPQGCRLEFLRSTIKELESTTPWLAELGLADFRDGAVRDLDKAWIAHGAKIKKMKSLGATDLPACKFKYRSKRDPQQSFEMRGRDWGRSSGQYASVFHRDKLKSAEPLPSDEVMQQHSFRVVCDRLGHYFLCVPMPARTWSESQAPKSQHGVVALDPGVRTFQTCYDADGTVVEWGAGDMKQIFRNCLCADKLQSKWQQTKKASIKKAWLRQLVRIKDRISEVHKKMASWLCNNYRVILIPQFDTSRMVRRVGRKINSKTARGMCTWAHFAFRQRLLQAAEQRPWCSVIVCDEAYTSKTCGQCGAIHAKLGGRKTFKCPACGYCADRDASAARNILIRYLTRNNIVPTGSLLTE